MKIAKVLYRAINIPLNFQFSQSNNRSARHSSSVILELHLSDGTIGYGEACPRMYVTKESLESLRKDLKAIAPQFATANIDHLGAWKKQLEDWRALGVGPSTICALELAGLDALAKRDQQSMSDLLGIQAETGSITYSQVIPMLKPDKLAKLLTQIDSLEPSSLKLKASDQMADNLANVSLLRACFGDQISIRVDVNAGWTTQQAQAFIPAFLAAGVNSFEQPLAADQLQELGELTRLFGEDAFIMADESLLDEQGARFLLEHKISNHFNLKVSKLGGIFKALAIYQLAASYEVPCQLGAHFGETSLLTAAGILLTHMAGPMSANEGALGEFLLEKDIVAPSLGQQANGQLATASVLQGIGLAPQLNMTALEEYTKECYTYQSYNFDGVVKRLSA